MKKTLYSCECGMNHKMPDEKWDDEWETMRNSIPCGKRMSYAVCSAKCPHIKTVGAIVVKSPHYVLIKEYRNVGD